MCSARLLFGQGLTPQDDFALANILALIGKIAEE
jgi:hypothetical protein